MSFKRLTTLLLMAFCFLTGTFAQRFIVTGTVESGKTNRGVAFVTAALLKSDSTGVTSAMTNEKGTFRLRAKSAGSYIVKISYVGFKTEYRNIVLTRQTDSINIGRIPLENSDNLLKEAVVSVTAASLSISDLSISRWIILACLAYLEGTPVIRSLNRMPMAMSTSHS